MDKRLNHRNPRRFIITNFFLDRVRQRPRGWCGYEKVGYERERDVERKKERETERGVKRYRPVAIKTCI